MNPLHADLLTVLSTRDLAILDDLEQLRLLTTRQLQQAHFPVGAAAHATPQAATKAAMRVLRRLETKQLVSSLARRIGGVRRGSQSYIWQLTSTGDRIQRLRRGESGRRRYVEPGGQFVEHTLAVADLAITLRTLARAGHIELLDLQSEPACWREFTGPHGTPQILKPDLYAVTATSTYEDHWFLETDRATEHTPAVLNKCRTYARYAATATEQQHTGVFPAVRWIVPDQARASLLRRAIAADTALPHELFAVLTTREFTEHITKT